MPTELAAFLAREAGVPGDVARLRIRLVRVAGALQGNFSGLVDPALLVSTHVAIMFGWKGGLKIVRVVWIVLERSDEKGSRERGRHKGRWDIFGFPHVDIGA